MDYVKTLQDIASELVSDKNIAKLIGRKGMMANSIRQLMSVCGRLNDKKLDIKFESYGE